VVVCTIFVPLLLATADTLWLQCVAALCDVALVVEELWLEVAFLFVAEDVCDKAIAMLHDLALVVEELHLEVALLFGSGGELRCNRVEFCDEDVIVPCGSALLVE
jgi:hypothetical protein